MVKNGLFVIPCSDRNIMLLHWIRYILLILLTDLQTYDWDGPEFAMLFLLPYISYNFQIEFIHPSRQFLDSFDLFSSALLSNDANYTKKNFKNKCASSSKSLFLLLKSMAMIPIWLWLNYKILSKNSIEMFAVLYVQNFHDMELVYVCISFSTYA